MPTFQGGLQSAAATKAYGRDRDSIDPDDFRGGFGVWSGTSFAGPLLAGRIARHLSSRLSEGDSIASAMDRAKAAVAALTEITPD